MTAIVVIVCLVLMIMGDTTYDDPLQIQPHH
ncbi:uncharacterized protein FRV6_02029 [Fusarium oxysporum]|uniref:Uncharacterized protein n=1 Tax=Fusarium oxysporum TaxID=5507 RepID=A0A2H3SMY9_FUSOX|nr:uncharacterized protein FRV6_02029 [Fusarium oxysporum]